MASPHAMNVVFVKLGAIGDAVMALSLVSALAAHHPQARLTWMCGRLIEPLLRLFPQIHELVVVDERALFGPSRAAALRELLRVQRQMFGRRFDLLLHGNSDWRYRLLTATARAGETRGWSREHERPWPIPGRYHGDEYARLVTLAEDGGAVRWRPPAPALTISPRIRELVAGEGRLVLLSPGGAKNLLADSSLRRWPLERYASLARALVQRGHRIAIIGGESDRWVLPAFNGIPHLDLIGRTSLPELLAVFALAALVISHDTASVHLPRLTGTPVVALFGPTPPTQFIPSDANGQVLWGGAHLPCRPCYDGKNYSGCHKNSCMMAISVAEVLRSAERFLDEMPEARSLVGANARERHA